MKRLANVAAVLVLTVCGSDAWSQDLPLGWRKPSAGELTEPLRKDSPVAFASATADFNGDGFPDHAVLLKSTRFSGEGLWIELSNAEGGFFWVKLAETNWGKEFPTVDLAMGIDVVTPGVHAYCCFDEARDCECGPRKDRPKLKLNDPSFTYFKFESAASLFFWSKKHNKFMRVWLSD